MAKKRILIFAHYYHPDVASTGQIIKDLAERMLDEFDVTVICTVPSYGGTIEKKYKQKKYYLEKINGVKVIRVRVPAFSKSNKISRIKNIVAYFFGSLSAARRSGKQDYIFAISQPPILGGLLGVCGKWMKQAKMIYCIQDFNPEQIIAVGYIKNKLILKTLMGLDKFSCKQSDLVITVGRDLVQTLIYRFEGKRVPNYTMINNWINEKEIYPLPPDNEKVLAFKKEYGLTDKFIFMYSGNIGLYYDLENLIKVIGKFQDAKTADKRDVVFAFVGSGSIKEKLSLYKKKHHLDNVIFIPYQDKDKLIYSLNAADVHWCVNAKGIKGVSCPSKFYGIVSVAKPVLGILEKKTEIRKIIEEIGCGFCIEPEDYINIEKYIWWFIENADSKNVVQMGEKGHDYLVENMSRHESIRKYKDAILNL